MAKRRVVERFSVVASTIIVKGTLSVFWVLVCLFSQPVFVVSQTPVPSVTPEIPTSEADLIHFGDLIDVDFAGSVEYDWRGSITQAGVLDGLNEFSQILALCRSEGDVAIDIVRVYSKILREPKVNVKIIDRSNRAVARLQGAVKVPTRFRIQRAVRLRELIVAAGGFTDDASGGISIFRPDELNCTKQGAGTPREIGSDPKTPQGNGIHQINISISELLSGKESANPHVLSGDTITVEKAMPIYVIGAVNDPGPKLARSGMSLSRAIATAGGLAKGAIAQKVSIFRREGTNTSVMQVDLEKIKSGEINDVDLKAFDIIEVAYKGRAQRKYPPVFVDSYRISIMPDLPLRIID